MADTATIQQGLDRIFEFTLRYAVTLAALGALTVGLLEAYKKLFATLARFQRNAVWRWLSDEAAPGAAARQLVATLARQQYGTGAPREGYDAARAYAELLHLTTGVALGAQPPAVGAPLTRNVAQALFELELAKMMAQVQEAADAALNNPARYRHWFDFLTRGCDVQDVTAWRDALAAGSAAPRPPQLAEVYARIRLLVRRQLDAFQTVTAYRWREWNQLWAWLVGGVLLMTAQIVQARTADVSITPMDVLMMVVVSLAGGILAPVAKDLVDALAKAKARG